MANITVTFNSTRWWIFAGAMLVIVLLWLLRPILGPFLIGMLLAYIGDPLADRLESRGISRSLSVGIVFFGITLLTVLAAIIALPLLNDQILLLIAKLKLALAWFQQQGLPYIRELFGISGSGQTLTSAKEALAGNWDSAGNFFWKLLKQITGSSLALTVWVTNLILIPVVTFYMLRDFDKFTAKVRDLLPRAYEPTVVKLAQNCDEILSAFIRGQLIVMASLAIIYTLGLWAIGLELALVIGALAGLISIVPYLGTIVGVFMALIAGWFQFQELWVLFVIGGVFGIGQMLEGFVLTPNLVGDRIGLHPVAVIFAILAGGQLFGFVGILLALPGAAVLKVLIAFGHQKYLQSPSYEGKSLIADSSNAE